MAKRADMRAAALDTLVDIERNKKLSHIAIGETLMRYQFAQKTDRAFYTRLCEGVTEQKIYLDYILDHFSKTPVKKCKPVIRCLLRMGAYQILFMETRDAAACSEAVNLAKKRGFGRLSGFVNGVLRSLVRGKDQLPLPDKEKDYPQYLSVRYSVPLWLTRRIISWYGEETTEKILASFLEARPLTIRTNLSQICPEVLKKDLEAEGVKVMEGNYLSYAFSLSGINSLNRLSSFRNGAFAVQDESSQLVVEVADIRENDRILDVCAAPGGKTFHAADLLRGTGEVIARDLTEYKTELIEENKERMHAENVRIEQWDARKEDPALLGKMDKVFADLPCSGLGIMGRKNDIKYQISEEQLHDLVLLQREILSVVWRYVKPGGEFLFSTCTINREENEENVRWIAENTPLIPISIEEKLPDVLKKRTGEKGYLQLIPGVDHCDGFFISKFRRPEEEKWK
ncbi:MAG: 16S rRNA (cytosine(967)-C(5))-methyltransferase RsmB [Eubacterium sp.]|nr:16S rRNA (cytosine(967)-C(5))-methyltransferase RsmB [Eubacterium sp.]MDD7209572.1 16S rRNA (cytosine(967)-C(5))-methyltransferase RsmB [Lachnospiraceae bacterium]MDY5497172.1 16S rRNA (cytosine(967)-C(5))-methyltransferase RsmB [Anaerobutyricum sp.]